MRANAEDLEPEIPGAFPVAESQVVIRLETREQPACVPFPDRQPDRLRRHHAPIPAVEIPVPDPGIGKTVVGAEDHLQFARGGRRREHEHQYRQHTNEESGADPHILLYIGYGMGKKVLERQQRELHAEQEEDPEKEKPLPGESPPSSGDSHRVGGKSR